MGFEAARVLRYNYSILMSTGYWLLVLPVAASQLVTLAVMAMASGFSENIAFQIGELLPPILGAFLASHCMAPEYRSGIGAILACKPVSMHRVVALRLALALLCALGLSAATLVVCSVGVQAVPVLPVLLAALPGLLFLSLLALTFATLARHALAGFTLAAAYWALDLARGFSIHPLLSLQAVSAQRSAELMSQFWPWNKAALLLGAAILLGVHNRLLRRLRQTPERGDLLRYAGVAALALLAYVVSGAAVKVGYGWLNRGRLPVRDVNWHQRQLEAYQPIPVAWLFGPAYAALVDAPAGGERQGEGSGGEARLRRLEEALRRWPRSIWADALAAERAHLLLQQEGGEALAALQEVADRFPHSPYAPQALEVIVAEERLATSEQQRTEAARRIMEGYADQPAVETAGRFLVPRLREEGNHRAAADIARRVARGVPEFRRPYWYLQAGEALLEGGDWEAATGELRRAAAEVTTLENRMRSDPDLASRLGPRRAELGRVLGEVRQLLEQLSGR